MNARRIGISIVAVAALCTGIAATLAFAQPKTSPQAPVPAPEAAAVALAAASAPVMNLQLTRGRYLVAMGDCIACHTAPGMARFSGGRPVETPFGTVLSANLTPDGPSGIGDYTPDTFYRAMHEGIDRQGRHLYPAFPYNYYTNVTREDTDAIFAYLKSLPPVRHEFERNRLSFPFNIRALMTVWNWMFLDEGPAPPPTGATAQQVRGAYLVQGLGHCAACHTPKNLLGGSKNDKAFQGGVFGQWFAPDITANQRLGIGGWTDDQLREFLRRGLNTHSVASGEMGEVVAFSTSQMTDADLDSVIAHLRRVPASPDRTAHETDAAVMKQGQAIWTDNCSACHRANGDGAPRYFPPLKGNANVQQDNATTVLHFILAGTRHVPNNAAPSTLAMPAYYWKLDDAQVAAVATYARNSWGNSASPVTAEQVGKLRSKLKLGTYRDPGEPVDLARPGPSTLGTHDTDSRDNGTAQAGRAASAASR